MLRIVLEKMKNSCLDNIPFYGDVLLSADFLKRIPNFGGQYTNLISSEFSTDNIMSRFEQDEISKPRVKPKLTGLDFKRISSDELSSKKRIKSHSIHAPSHYTKNLGVLREDTSSLSMMRHEAILDTNWSQEEKHWRIILDKAINELSNRGRDKQSPLTLNHNSPNRALTNYINFQGTRQKVLKDFYCEVFVDLSKFALKNTATSKLSNKK